MTLLRKREDQHLTSVDPSVDAKALATFAGQAHFAEKSVRCSACRFFAPLSKSDQLGRCRKAANLLMRDLFSMPSFPASARACKFFEAEEEAG